MTDFPQKSEEVCSDEENMEPATKRIKKSENLEDSEVQKNSLTKKNHLNLEQKEDSEVDGEITAETIQEWLEAPDEELDGLNDDELLQILDAIETDMEENEKSFREFNEKIEKIVKEYGEKLADK